jgi:plasmid stabilization system protein ParE
VIPIRWSRRAAANPESIYDYIAESNVTAAIKQRNLILRAIEQLQRFPRSGHRGRIPPLDELFVPKTSYVIFYRQTAEAIDLAMIRHVAQRPMKRPPID